jgi:hypothetical protein
MAFTDLITTTASAFRQALKTIFKRFTQAHADRGTSHVSGSGRTGHRGRLRAVDRRRMISPTGAGTTFVLRLPSPAAPPPAALVTRPDRRAV